jgi:uncharacterized repeat protein (TIGR03803 family)
MPGSHRTSSGRGRGSSESRRRRRALHAAGRSVANTVYRAEPLERRFLLSAIVPVAPFTPYLLGDNPSGSLVADGTGNVYGTNAAGGLNYDGTVFEWVKAANSTALVAAFNGVNGADPKFGLTMDATGDLFGTTERGGANNSGTVFEIAAGSNTITTLASFNMTDGAPDCVPVLDSNGDVFGTTGPGTFPNPGTFFEIVKGSGTATTISISNDVGGYPTSGLAMDSHGNLFGITFSNTNGTTISDGAVVEIPSGLNSIQIIASFNSTTGQAPIGQLLVDSAGDIFGTADSGGPPGVNPGQALGGVYEIKAGSNTITPLAFFQQTDSDSTTNTLAGGGTLIMDGDGNLYGATVFGGLNNDGTVFELSKGSNSITTLVSAFAYGIYGPEGSLLLDSAGDLLGATIDGSIGSIFQVAAGTKTFSILSTFQGNAVSSSYSPVISDNRGNLYGAADVGGSAGEGDVFEVPAGSNAVTTLASFTALTGNTVDGTLAFDSTGNLYGTTFAGGAYGYGTIFEVVAGSNTVTTLASFNGTNGDAPEGGVTLDAQGDLFGTTEYDVWELASGSNTITVLGIFDVGTNQRSWAQGAVALDSAGDVFGNTLYAGTSNDGTLFEVLHGSNSITTLASFNGTDGSHPCGGVTMDANGNIFGITASGGANGFGTAYELVNGSNTITVLASFNSAPTTVVGKYSIYNFPANAGLALDAAGNLFGVLPTAGDSNEGAVFEIANGTNTVTPLASFNGADGSVPYPGLTIDSSGDLLGVTLGDGQYNAGVVFEVPGAATVAPAISSFTINNGAAQRSMVTSATIVFNQPVNLATGAITLTQRATGGGSPTPITFTPATSDNTTWNLTFPGYTGGSLPDGIFDLTVTAADVTSVSAPTLAMSSDQTFTFDRLFGDADGNGIVNNADYFQFKKTYAQSTGSANYNPAFDYDANGIVNNADYFQFKARYGQQIVISEEPALSPDAGLLSGSDSSSNKDKTAALLL